MNIKLLPGHLYKTALISASVLGVASSAYSAVNVTANSLAGASKVTSSTGADLPSGSIVRLGYFANPGANDAILRGSSTLALEAIFTEIGSRNMTPGTWGTGALEIGKPAIPVGNFGGTISGVDNGTVPAGTPIYMWILNVNSVAAVPFATEWGIFHDPGWLIPDGTTILATLSMTTQQVNAQSEVFRGTDNGTTLSLAAIPEPSALALVIGSGFLFFVRRKR